MDRVRRVKRAGVLLRLSARFCIGLFWGHIYSPLIPHLQEFVGKGYFDEVSTLITGGSDETAALAHSTEAEQFGPRAGKAAP
jgi:hypothetical protein